MFVTQIARVNLTVGIVFAIATTSSGTLTGYFPLDEVNNPSIGTTVADASIGAHNGISLGDGTAPTGAMEGVASANAGLFGTAYNFSTASTELDYVDIDATLAAFNFLTRDSALSYAAWVKPAATQDFEFPTIIGTTGGAFDFRIVQSGLDWNLRLQSGNTPTNGVATTATIPSDVWTHVAVTKEAYNATTIPTPAVNFYINGVFAESGTVVRAGSGSTQRRLFIGTGALATEYYNGGVDEVYVYNEVLSASTIGAIAKGGDYNGDGKVDAADYVVWRKSDGSDAGYNLWRGAFGRPVAGGNGNGSLSAAGVPEPATLALVGLLASLLMVKRRSRVELVSVPHVATHSTL